VTVGLLWYAAETCSPGEWFCGLDAIVFGGGIGMVTAMVIDYVWASKPVTSTQGPEEKAISAKGNRSINLHAAAAPIGGGAKLVLGGSF
jgi:acetate kinase